jgi:hypothetical protein
MADVTQAEYMQQVEDSILDDSNIIAVLPHQGNLHPQDVGSDAEPGESQFDNPEDYYAEDIYAQNHDPQKLGDEGLRDLLRREGQEVADAPEELSEEERLVLSQEERILRKLENDQPETGREQAEQEQPVVELTAEQFQPIIEQTHQVVKDLGLIEAPKLTADLAPYFATPIAQHAEDIGLMVGGLALGSAQLLTQLYKDGTLDASKPMEFEKLSPLPSVACNYLSEKWCEFRGQSEPARDPVALGNSMRNGIANLIHSKGKTDPQMAVWWVQAMEKASTGRDVQVNAKEAMDFVNALTPHVRSAVQKIIPALARSTAQAKPSKGIPRMTSARKYDGIRTPGLRKQVRQVRNGLDAATLAVYQREHGRL